MRIWPRSSCRRSRSARRPTRAQRWVGVWGWISRETASTPATQAETKIAATTNSPAYRSARSERSRKAIAERDRGRGVAEVVDQVGEQSDAAAGDEDGRLGERGQAEHSQREPDRPQALARAHDAPVDEAVGVAVPALLVMIVMVLGLVAVRAEMGVGMG